MQDLVLLIIKNLWQAFDARHDYYPMSRQWNTQYFVHMWLSIKICVIILPQIMQNLPPFFFPSAIPKIQAQWQKYGGMVVDTDVLWTVFVYINENSLKICLQLLDISPPPPWKWAALGMCSLLLIRNHVSIYSHFGIFEW